MTNRLIFILFSFLLYIRLNFYLPKCLFQKEVKLNLLIFEIDYRFNIQKVMHNKMHLNY